MTLQFKFIKLVIISITFPTLFASKSFAHARFDQSQGTVPMDNSSGIKDGGAPCGNLQNAVIKPLQAGSNYTLHWEETVDHNGWYELYFSETGPCNVNNRNFDSNLKTDCWRPVTKVMDTQNNGISGTNYHKYSFQYKLPNVNCENCVFQLRQVMGGNVNNLYYSCHKVKLSGATSGGTGLGEAQCKPGR